MKIITLFLMLAVSGFLYAQEAIIIDHQCIDLSDIPEKWIDSAKNKLFIGYGHTSHGSQLTSGMDAVESYYTDGTYDWSHTGGPGELHLFEGSGYGSGYLELDCGYNGWDDETREYLDDFPGCNVIIWSWCGQVNDVDLQTHYLQPMEQLENEYPGVDFVYMTGHLEGLGPEGSLFHANQQIRDYCNENNKILFDFADIEKYSPDADTNYQEYYADDGCNYYPPGGGVSNWAYNWLNNNPEHELTRISDLCANCAHSVSLNCVKKGIACWFLWARLAGWDGQQTRIDNPGNEETSNNKPLIYPNPFIDEINISFPLEVENTEIELCDIHGKAMIKQIANGKNIKIDLSGLSIPKGIYFVFIRNNDCSYCLKVISERF